MSSSPFIYWQETRSSRRVHERMILTGEPSFFRYLIGNLVPLGLGESSGAKRSEEKPSESNRRVRVHARKAVVRNNIDWNITEWSTSRHDGKPGIVKSFLCWRPPRGEPMLSGVKISAVSS